MAKVVKELGVGDQTRGERELSWNRGTIRKGMKELTTGKPIENLFHRRGRKPVESKLPNFLQDLRAIVEARKSSRPLLINYLEDKGFTSRK